ncbi:MAG TPA: PspA/IM30 family protein [Bosea sp. (in: a-proteobacteria)]|jgi:phage shock protein A|uniref:PspA/IM30 family protein n=1 Tax=Bosea sp. (in: a-proteobacteria) TaxID=1871050 RepID=UPI002E13A093|nr:PspA/IM30 family protein [Bosea sp. (in: a-proteobacteria)]
MLKMFLTFIRGGAAIAEERFADRNALVILDQQLRDAASTFERAKKALALAIAQDQQESMRLAAGNARIADLELRVSAALVAGDDGLARDGAEAIASLEADRDAAASAQVLFAAEIVRLRRHVGQAQTRIAELDRGRRLARASEAVRNIRRGRIDAGLPHEATLAEAEQTLKRLRERQVEADAADLALDEFDGAAAASITEKLAARGFGPRLRASAEDVLERLRARQVQPS